MPLNLNKTKKIIVAPGKDCYQCFSGSFYLKSVPCEEIYGEKSKKCNQECHQNITFK